MLGLFLFSLFSFVLGYLYHLKPIIVIFKWQIITWPYVSAFGIFSVFTYQLFNGIISQEVYFSFFWLFLVSFFWIAYFAQKGDTQKKSLNNLFSDLEKIAQMIKPMVKKVDFLWIGYSRITLILPYLQFYF